MSKILRCLYCDKIIVAGKYCNKECQHEFNTRSFYSHYYYAGRKN